jgi:Rha family phage regulatory protein
MNTAHPTQLPILNFQDFIAADGEVLTTTSLQVAAVHGKRHDNVVQLIRKRLLVAGSWGLLNFKETAYADAQGRVQPMFEMTRDGYAFLVGKLTGRLAAQHQIAYIEAFNAMSAYIKNQRDGLRYRCMEKELECKDSLRRGSFHGRGLNQRKQEKPVLEAELSALLNEAQPSLPLRVAA